MGDAPKSQLSTDCFAAATAAWSRGYKATALEGRGFVAVGYIHCCATELGSHLGPRLWKEICRWANRKRLMVVACHPILLQHTVDFWRAQGMKHLSADDPQDQNAFRAWT